MLGFAALTANLRKHSRLAVSAANPNVNRTIPPPAPRLRAANDSTARLAARAASPGVFKSGTMTTDIPGRQRPPRAVLGILEHEAVRGLLLRPACAASRNRSGCGLPRCTSSPPLKPSKKGASPACASRLLHLGAVRRQRDDLHGTPRARSACSNADDAGLHRIARHSPSASAISTPARAARTPSLRHGGSEQRLAASPGCRASLRPTTAAGRSPRRA